MYPRNYYDAFRRYEANDQVFVAMPFTDSFKKAFDRVIEPAIKRVSVGGRQLSARIINRATSGSPDIHEQIFDAILHSRIVVADMTVQASAPAGRGALRWQANANVAYEVGLAAAWRNPEDILLVHQGHPEHSYSFDVQNLRHIQYEPDSDASIALLAGEIVRAINQSGFLANRAYQKLLEEVSPSAIQFMHQEVQRAFPIIAFSDGGMPIMDARIHAATELLAAGALKNRHVVRQGEGKGVAVIYEWTDLGIRMLESLRAATAARAQEMRAQVASVPSGTLPPAHLRHIPPSAPTSDATTVDMEKAVENTSASNETGTVLPPSA